MDIKTGIDICSIVRIKKFVDKYQMRALTKILNEMEYNQCYDIRDEKIIFNYSKIAKRFAAKEAFAKAVGLGIGSLGFKDIIIVNDCNKAPKISLSPKAEKFLKQDMNWDKYNIAVSLSDDVNIAVASVVILLMES